MTTHVRSYIYTHLPDVWELCWHIIFINGYDVCNNKCGDRQHNQQKGQITHTPETHDDRWLVSRRLWASLYLQCKRNAYIHTFNTAWNECVTLLEEKTYLVFLVANVYSCQWQMNGTLMRLDRFLDENLRLIIFVKLRSRFNVL